MFPSQASPYLCLGMTLARRELEVALGRLVQRMPRLRFDEERPRRRADSLVFRGLESLPVRLDWPDTGCDRTTPLLSNCKSSLLNRWPVPPLVPPA
jgi:hypothetical protein